MGKYQDIWHDAYNKRNTAKSEAERTYYNNIMNKAHQDAVASGTSNYGKGNYVPGNSTSTSSYLSNPTGIAQGGYSYNHGYDSFSDLYKTNPNWTVANVKGVTYHNKPDGVYQQVGMFYDNTPHLYKVGNGGYNSATGELTTSPEDARRIAFDRYVQSTGIGGEYTANNYNNYVNSGKLDDRYATAISNGTAGVYNRAMRDEAKKVLARKALAAQAKKNGVTPEQQNILNNNSFESSANSYDILGTNRIKQADLDYINRNAGYLNWYL